MHLYFFQPGDLIAPWNIFPDDPSDDGAWKETKIKKYNTGKYSCEHCSFKATKGQVLMQHLIYHKIKVRRKNKTRIC